MLSLDLKLTAEGMKNIPPELLHNDFEFVVGSKIYQCPRLIATFLSRKVSRLCTLDPTIDEYWVDTPYPLQQFPQFLSLGYSSNLVVTDANRGSILSIARELENTELRSSLFSELEEGMSLERVCGLDGSDPISLRI
jgi:hypothetical protein